MKSGRSDPRQLSLEDGFWAIPKPPQLLPGSLAYSDELCGALSHALKETPLSRGEVAARMSDLAAAEISEATINAWTARSKGGHRFPFGYAAAFEAATGSIVLQQLLASKRGSLVLIGQEARDARLGQVRRRIAALREEERSLMGGRRK
ncbi:hypothetical protein P7L75_01060 (plasmid) [Tistrella mobilis]|uniref:hypothetical protein n=1 Tax=Tistrella mobilis TaxID=171437 RepID=UPI0035578A96